MPFKRMGLFWQWTCPLCSMGSGAAVPATATRQARLAHLKNLEANVKAIRAEVRADFGPEDMREVEA